MITLTKEEFDALEMAVDIEHDNLAEDELTDNALALERAWAKITSVILITEE